MAKDLTVSRLDRQNILNNDLAVEELQNTVEVKAVFWNEKYYLTKEMIAAYFDVDVRTVERYISNFSDELKANGYELLKAKNLQAFITAYDTTFATDINVGRKIRSISVFDFRAFLNMAMLLAESDKARALRQMMLDVVIDLINRKTGGGTKYINQRDKDWITIRKRSGSTCWKCWRSSRVKVSQSERCRATNHRPVIFLKKM